MGAIFSGSLRAKDQGFHCRSTAACRLLLTMLERIVARMAAMARVSCNDDEEVRDPKKK
jgi:hypothetical protein